MSDLLGSKHSNENEDINEVLAILAKDPLAYYDRLKHVRKYPVFVMDPDGTPISISHWQNRHCAPEGMSITEAANKQLDIYIEGRGWIRRGVKPEKDYSENK